MDHSRWSGAWAAAFGTVTGGLLFWLAHRSLPDDAWITTDYARTLAEYGQWGMIHGQSANSATSPLNVGLLALGTVVTGRPILAVGLLLVACLAVTGWWLADLARISGVRPWLPYAAVAVLATSPLLASTVGLETYLGVALLVGLVRYGIEGRWLPAGVLAGLLVLCRPDYAVLAAVVAVTLPELRRRLLPATAVGCAVALPWFAGSWVWLGSALPDSLVLKTSEHDWHGYTIAAGFVFYPQFFPPAVLLLAVVPAAVGAVCLLGWTMAGVTTDLPAAASAAAAFGLAGLAHFAALVLLGVPPYAWYYGPLLTGLSLCALVTAAHITRGDRAMGPAILAATVVTTAVAVTVTGLAPWREAPIVGNFATAQEYEQVGRGVARIVPPGEPVGSPGEVGTVAYWCSCRLVDKFTDRPSAAVEIRKAEDSAGPLWRWLLTANYARLPHQPTPAVTVWRLEYRDATEPARSGDVARWPATTTWHKPGQVVLMRVPSGA